MQAGTGGLQAQRVFEFSASPENEIVIIDDDPRSVSRIFVDRSEILNETQSPQVLASSLTAARNKASTVAREFGDILIMTLSMSLPEAATMNLLTGPRMYYSLLGPFGVVLGAKSRLLRKVIQIGVEIAGIRHPVHLRLRTSDVWLCQQILIDAQYDSGLSVQPRVIVDGGANIGLASIYYANKYPEASIIAVEPEQSNFEMLQKNVSPYPKILPIRAALWNKNQDLYSSAVVSGHHAYQVRDQQVSGRDSTCNIVRGLSLQGLMADFGIQQIDLLKVDIEGSEKEVFHDSARWIGRVGMIAIEIHDWMRSGCGESVYAATSDFELKWKRGETTYFARTRDIPSSQLDRRVNVTPGAPVARQATSRFPMKIIQVV
jgi:FkbM family methyltransferase